MVTYLLPNIPQAHYVLWGCEAAGIANPINPMLEPDTIRDICIAAVRELQPGETVMVGLPLFHCNGTCVTGLMPFNVGGHLVMLSPQGYRDASLVMNF